MIALAAGGIGLPAQISRRKQSRPRPVIRYMNLKAVYNFSLNRNRDALDVKKKLDEKIARMKEVERDLNEPATDHVALLEEYRTLDAELSALEGPEQVLQEEDPGPDRPRREERGENTEGRLHIQYRRRADLCEEGV